MGANPFSSWKLNDEHNLTVLVKGGRNFLVAVVVTSRELSGTHRFNQKKYKFGLVWYGMVFHSIMCGYCT